MPTPPPGSLAPPRLLFDLQQANEIAQGFSDRLDATTIARQMTDGIVEKFNCAFARLWLLETDRLHLRLVASSGLYTNLQGRFSRIAMGAYKVGKIAQNRVSFLSNNLPAEPWVGDRDWALANQIQGFAGYPLAIHDRVVGVLAVFSHYMLEPEFLEVLQSLCTIGTIALDAALQYQQEKQQWQSSLHAPTFHHLPLSEQLAHLFQSTRLTLVGTEQSLATSLVFLFLRTAEWLNTLKSGYCRLVYTDTSVALEAIVPVIPVAAEAPEAPEAPIRFTFSQLTPLVASLGGTLQIQTSVNQRSVQVILRVPYCSSSHNATPHAAVTIQCRLPVLQLAFTHLAIAAGLTVNQDFSPTVPLLTDDIIQSQTHPAVLWIRSSTLGHSHARPLDARPKGVKAVIDLSIDADQLRQAIETVQRGETWGDHPVADVQAMLSERELEILSLLTQGHRDRDIADRLVISESTVKFHLNNVLAKLKARTRYQAIREAIVRGWIG